MSHPYPQLPAPQPVQAIIQRIALPLCLFLGVLFSLLLLSYLLLLPRFTQFARSDGTSMSPREMVQYQRMLSADITKKEEERVKLVLPISDESFNLIKKEKYASMTLIDLREQLMQAASRIGESSDAIVISQLQIDGDKVVFEGDVRNVQTRSMTVLAAYVEEIEKLPFVSNLIRPTFSRAGTVETGFHSPFTFTLTLAQTK